MQVGLRRHHCDLASMLHIICCGSHTITPEVSLALRCELYQCPASLFNEISSLVLRRDFGNTLANVRILVLIHQHRSKRIQQPTSPSIPSSRHVFPSTDVPRTYQLLRKKSLPRGALTSSRPRNTQQSSPSPNTASTHSPPSDASSVPSPPWTRPIPPRP